MWIVDKRAALEASRGNARLAEVFLQLCRKDAANLAKLKHPNVVRLLEPFEETRSQLVMVTEAVTASLADVIKLRKAAAVAGGGAGSLHLSELEIKHGFLQVLLLQLKSFGVITVASVITLHVHTMSSSLSC